MERYTELTKERLLNITARVNEPSVGKILRFTNKTDGTPHPISSYDFEIILKKIPRAAHNVFVLTIGDGLTVQGDDENELLIEVSEERATQRPDVYFWRLFSNAQSNTWLNGDWCFFVGKYDGVLSNCTDMNTCGDVNIEIVNASADGVVQFGGLWNFTDNGGDFPESPLAGGFYVAEDDHGVFGDADFVAAGAWMIAKIDGADEFGDYYIKF